MVSIQISRKEILKNITGRPQKYCIECRVFFPPAALEKDVHATHYCWNLPLKAENFDSWLSRIRARDESVWGVILDEDGTRSTVFCPSEFEVIELP